MPGRGQLLSCVARDPVLSQPSALPLWQCDSKAQSRAPRVMAFLLHIFLFERGNSSFLEVSSRLSLVAHWSGQEHMLPGHSTTEETGMTMTGFHPSRPIPRPQEPGAMHLNTSAGEKKETVSNSKALHSIPVHDFWCPTRWGVGFLRAGVLSPHQSEIPGHPCLFQTRNPGRTGAVFPPRIPIKIHGLLMNIIPFIYCDFRGCG